ncbi:MAG: hypothetical protein DWQ04_13805 [Chloroflexi bacterium]|nr:MAG: hypothetical protein DWQ04_13805 [Chloroflexota bacterium]
MYARMVTVSFKLGTITEAVGIYEDSVVPVMRQQTGSKGATLLVNKSTNTAVSTSFWETEAAMLAGEANGYLQKEMSKFAQFFAAPPESAHYEVRTQM